MLLAISFKLLAINAYFPKKSKICPDLIGVCYNLPMSKKKVIKDKKLHVEAVKQMVALSTSGFGLVAALAWNGVIQEFVNNYIKKWLPNGSGLASLFIYAVVVTVLAVTITLQLTRLSEKLQKKA